MPSLIYSRAHYAVRLLVMVLLVSAAACDDDHHNTIATPTATEALPTDTVAPAPTDTVAPQPTTPAAIATATPIFTATAVPTTPVATSTATSSATASAAPSDTDTPAATSTATRTATPEPTATPTGIQVNGSVEQVWVIGAPPQTDLELRDGEGHTTMTGTSDANGSLIFRKVAAAAGYRVYSSTSGETSAAVDVTSAEQAPDSSLYSSQQLHQGYGYLRTRDGTLLSINVLMPGPESSGPYPTVIEYSGYSPSDPASPQPSSLILSNIGFAVVGVNIRGTGCSGGAFDYFETLQSTDGYDVIETVAAQPWVKFHSVGMIGISYPGITQLFVGQTQPPHLAAIAPLSVVSDLGQGILYPGGILNNGFAVEWAQGRQNDARPGGQPWSQKRIDDGDRICIANQRLRAQTPDILQRVEDTPYYDPAVVDPLSPVTFVNKINVPVYLGGAWQDEQTGGYFPNMLDHFTGTDKLHFTMTNGGHIDSLGPHLLGRWMEFLSLYVAREIPHRSFTVQAVLRVMAQGIFGVPRLTLEPERYNDVTTYEEALARFEAEPKVRILFENGGLAASPGAQTAAFEHSFDEWPIPSLQPTTWYFADQARLDSQPPPADANEPAIDSYRYDTSRSQMRTLDVADDAVWKAMPPWNWQPLAAGTAVAYATDPLEQSYVMAGSGSVDLWFSSTATDVDLQVTLSEIRPDGKEVFVQSGWLRASQRKLDQAASTVLRPQHTHRIEDVEPLPVGELVPLRVELFPFAHVFRPGSRIRIAVDTPGGTRPRWKFRVLEPEGEVTNTVSHSLVMPSKVVLPVIPDITPPAELPRAQVCAANRAATTKGGPTADRFQGLVPEVPLA